MRGQIASLFRLWRICLAMTNRRLGLQLRSIRHDPDLLYCRWRMVCAGRENGPTLQVLPLYFHPIEVIFCH